MRRSPRWMQNSSLHSFSLRLHFHAQYLQNKAYKPLIAKIFPVQLGYLALSAPSYFPSASLRSAFTGGEGKRSYPRDPDPPEQPQARSAAPGAARAGGTDSGAAPGSRRAASARRAPRLPAAAESGGRPPVPRCAGTATGGLKARRAEADEAPKLRAARCTDVPLSLEVKAEPHRGSAAAPAGAALPGGRWQRPGETPPPLPTGKDETSSSRAPSPLGQLLPFPQQRRHPPAHPRRVGEDRSPPEEQRGAAGTTGRERPPASRKPAVGAGVLRERRAGTATCVPASPPPSYARPGRRGRGHRFPRAGAHLGAGRERRAGGRAGAAAGGGGRRRRRRWRRGAPSSRLPAAGPGGGGGAGRRARGGSSLSHRSAAATSPSSRPGRSSGGSLPAAGEAVTSRARAAGRLLSLSARSEEPLRTGAGGGSLLAAERRSRTERCGGRGGAGRRQWRGWPGPRAPAPPGARRAGGGSPAGSPGAAPPAAASPGARDGRAPSPGVCRCLRGGAVPARGLRLAGMRDKPIPPSPTPALLLLGAWAVLWCCVQDACWLRVLQIQS